MEQHLKEIEIGEIKRREFAQSLISTKYDLDDKLDIFINFKMKFYEKDLANTHDRNIEDSYDEDERTRKWTETMNSVHSDLITLVEVMYPSLLAPFLHYNNYIDYFCNDFLWDDIKYNIPDEQQRDSNVLRKTKYQIEIQALLIAIKSGLDRFVGLFSYYYKGIAPYTTFGRFKDKKNTFEGLMNTVEKNKDSDPLMEFIFDQYFKWIKIAVAPRDTIIHYNDLGIFFEFDSEIEGGIPVHFNERLIKEKDKVEDVYKYSYESIKGIVESWLEFVNKVFSELLKKEPILQHARF